MAARCELVDGMKDDTLIPDSDIILEPNAQGTPTDIRPTGSGWKTTGPEDRVVTISDLDLTPGGVITLIDAENVKDYTVEFTKPIQVIYIELVLKSYHMFLSPPFAINTHQVGCLNININCMTRMTHRFEFCHLIF